jgi:hypothetical protein
LKFPLFGLFICQNSKNYIIRLYVLGLNSYEEYPEDDPKDSVQVLRKSKIKGKEREIYKKQMKYTAVDKKNCLQMTDDDAYTAAGRPNFCCHIKHSKIIIKYT